MKAETNTHWPENFQRRPANKPGAGRGAVRIWRLACISVATALALGCGADASPQAGDLSEASELEWDVAKSTQSLLSGAGNVHQELDVPLARSYRKTFKPTNANEVTVKVDQPQNQADPMVLVLRWRHNNSWEFGSQPTTRTQAAFDVVAFNNDAPGLGKGAQVKFKPDGRSFYTLFVMPRDSGQGSLPKARLTITGCTGCNVPATVVPVVGHTLRNASGNAFEIGSVSGTAGNPWLFALRLFPRAENATEFEGYGISNEGGRGPNNGWPAIHANFTLAGAAWDLVFTTTAGTPSSTAMAHLMLGTELPIPGLQQRPPNTSCIAPRNASEIKATIAETGCFDPYWQTPSPDLIPYEVAHPFWSDGVHKTRYLVLPDNTSIYVDYLGRWHMPPGGMMIKNFFYNSKLFETRFLVQLAEGNHLEYTYDWREGLPAGARRADVSSTLLELRGDPHLGDLNWNFPSTAQCESCHKEGGGNEYFLGLNSRQLNIDIQYPSTGLVANQISSLRSIGMLDGPGLDTLFPPYEPRPDAPLGTDPSWEQARAYVDVNCGYCHNETNLSLTKWPAGIPRAFEDMGVCNVPGSFGGKDILEPDSSLNSFMFERANSTTPGFMMPVLAKTRVDTAGMALLDSWIGGMNANSCTPPTNAIQMAYPQLVNQTNVSICLVADVRSVDPQTGVPATAKNVDARTCNASTAAQGFTVIDDGMGFVSLRPALQDPHAHPTLGDCLELSSAQSIVRRTCGSRGAWYRDYLPGGGYQLVYNSTKQCLTKFTYGARLEPCQGKNSQIWKSVPR